MKLIENMPVGRKLFAAFGLVLAAIAVMGVVVVTSAMSGVTNMLIEAAQKFVTIQKPWPWHWTRFTKLPVVDILMRLKDILKLLK